MGAFTALSSTLATAATLELQTKQVYLGDEYFNEKPTGNKCSVTINDVSTLNAVGKYCYQLEMTIYTANPKVPKLSLTLESRVTNMDMPEYPQMKTCAMNINGSVSGQEIYGDDTTKIYTQFFSGGEKINHLQYDFELTVSPTTKKASEASVHLTTWSTEDDVSCLDLKLQ